jgi:hypothetical protein
MERSLAERRDMRLAVLAAVLAGVFALAAPANAQVPVPRHLHCLTNSSGQEHAIARGLTANAPQSAFETFHFGVHLGVFVEGPNPHALRPSFTGTC